MEIKIYNFCVFAFVIQGLNSKLSLGTGLDRLQRLGKFNKELSQFIISVKFLQVCTTKKTFYTAAKKKIPQFIHSLLGQLIDLEVCT